MLRVAVPNKARLAEPAVAMLEEAGYRQRSSSRELVLTDDDNQIEFYYLRPRDIAVYVGQGMLDVGITGRDLLLDTGAPAEEILPLGFAASTFRLAARPGVAQRVEDLNGRRVATSLVGLMRGYLADRGIDASVIRLDGAVETAIQLGVADVIADVVETGSTLRQAGLEVFGEPILRSEAVLIKRAGAEPERLDQMLRRLQGVLVARSYVLMDFDIRADRIDQAAAIAPGLEGPTVSPLHREGWVAVRVMVPRKDAQRLMDELWEIGARAILVTDIHACRL
ncbi:MAG TPA: ATP phosphoribosyltransferase [Actinopolymorphaceae bacterium]